MYKKRLEEATMSLASLKINIQKDQFYYDYLGEIQKSILKYNKLLIPFMLLVFLYFLFGDFFIWHIPAFAILRYPGIFTCLLLLSITFTKLKENRTLVIVSNNLHCIALLIMGFGLVLMGPEYNFKGIVSCILFIVASHFFVKGYRPIVLIYSIGFILAVATLVYAFLNFEVYHRAEIVGLVTVYIGIIILSFYNERVRYNEFFLKRNLEEEKNKTHNLYIETQTKNEQLRKINKQLDDARSRLEELDKSKNKLFSIIAHDLRGPVAAVVSMLEQMKENLPTYESEEILELVTLLEHSTNSTLALLNNLLFWASNQLDGIKIERTQHQLAGIVEKSISAYLHAAELKHITIEVDIDKDSVVFADEKTLGVVIANLFNNAIKFTHKGGEITLASKVKGSEITLSIKDNGIGMKPEIKQKLFVLDENVKRQGTENEKGTGLGLILSAEFISSNKGKIKVESEENKGSCFSITLPTVSDQN